MPRLIWSPAALTDVQKLYRFLVKKDESAARRAIKTIRASVKILAHQPEVGRPAEDMDPVFREWLIDFGSSGYIVLYRFDGETATILAVRHQKEAGY
ncbi:type II toxin-antitoxin system RelE/ParE family toxin [Xenorhabdus bovienii]|uniref:Type II toxin-antitoxin system RelE/ParE family toxin n=1 Tax=Xenorhabdus bovienii TaxID=40576 RepID=A0AAJ1J941_XENBV|nr:type II toxin-antitoxin system RelE/ParE family toxin [Xenorhabdus bovienii]MDE1479234.1 type II toxin-antitoxin system RelE/ParE family toxin [Xenorhabdus bovienii]MDE1492175.1 type II toxin-antitoxin system RelE/ParE family toxin [Xenorhabdus bovienii]MDE1496501.1 type II toxin-antitoxin system RelE/ParE family toxin [Xenorhabdus bovienii]MDE9474513.1 type II toxin-antitoxin system RelE/ParE family toxin [Xenorhabdus bovienii]MDE9511586.1 type II toxin-antitoxin system RelE/ParE family to